jgi:hypothetical protein
MSFWPNNRGARIRGDDPADAQKARHRSLMRASQTPSNLTVPPVPNDPLNTTCRALIEESMGCEDDQATLQDA